MAVRIFALTLVSGLAVIPAFAQEDGQTAFEQQLPHLPYDGGRRPQGRP